MNHTFAVFSISFSHDKNHKTINYMGAYSTLHSLPIVLRHFLLLKLLRSSLSVHFVLLFDIFFAVPERSEMPTQYVRLSLRKVTHIFWTYILSESAVALSM